jgi:hypothetical protein
MASRRKEAKPAIPNRAKDLCLFTVTDPVKLVRYLIPMNESKFNPKAKKYIDNLKVVGEPKPMDVFHQSTTIKSYSLLKCLNEETSQTIYVDINATLPKITRTDTNTSWNHCYSF